MATKSVQNLKAEISIIEKESLFWERRLSEIEAEYDKLEKDDSSSSIFKREVLEFELAAIAKRMRKEMVLLEKFKVKYNKEAKKLGLPLLED